MLPDNAITVKEESETLWEKPCPPNKEPLSLKVKCACGFRGTIGDLMCDPNDSKPPPNNFWCPQCEARAWSFI